MQYEQGDPFSMKPGLIFSASHQQTTEQWSIHYRGNRMHHEQGGSIFHEHGPDASVPPANNRTMVNPLKGK
jgi:hypothetical protein